MTTYFYKLKVDGCDYAALMAEEHVGPRKALRLALKGVKFEDAMRDNNDYGGSGGYWYATRIDCDTVNEKKRRMRDLVDREDDRDYDEAKTTQCWYFDGDDVDGVPPVNTVTPIDDTARLDFIFKKHLIPQTDRDAIDRAIRNAVKPSKWKVPRKSQAAGKK